MIDPDIIADLDPTTGLPVVDHQSLAQRWHDALNHSSRQNLHQTPLYQEKLSTRSGPKKPTTTMRHRPPQKTPNSK